MATEIIKAGEDCGSGKLTIVSYDEGQHLVKLREDGGKMLVSCMKVGLSTHPPPTPPSTSVLSTSLTYSACYFCIGTERWYWM